MLGTKLSWRGARARVLRLSETSLSTHDPADGRPTNTWRLAEVVSAEVHGLVLQLRFSGACALCGLIVPTLSFSLPDSESAIAMCAAIRAQLCRVVSHESSEVRANPNANPNPNPNPNANANANANRNRNRNANPPQVHRVEMSEEMGEAVLEPLADPSPPPVVASRRWEAPRSDHRIRPSLT